jgi:hypothetical protein
VPGGAPPGTDLSAQASPLPVIPPAESMERIILEAREYSNLFLQAYIEHTDRAEK